MSIFPRNLLLQLSEQVDKFDWQFLNTFKNFLVDKYWTIKLSSLFQFFL